MNNRKPVYIIVLMVWIALMALPTTLYADASNAISLEDAIARALFTHDRIREQHLLYEEANDDYRMARADLLFHIDGAYGYTDMKKQPVMKSDGTNIPISHQTLYSWHADIVQPLFAGFGLTTQVKLKNLAREIKKLEIEQAELDVISDVKKAYYQTLLYDKLLKTAEEAVASLRSHVENAEKFHTQGLIPNTDLLKSRVGLANAEQERVKAQGAADISRSNLNLLLDNDIDALIQIQDVGQVPHVDIRRKDLIARALQGRPVMRALHMGLGSVGLTIKLSRSGYYPKVALVGRYEQTGDNPSATNNDFSHASNASLSVQAQWTLFSWGSTTRQVSKAKHAYQAMEARIRHISDGIRMEVRQSVMALAVAEKNIDTADLALDQARENWRTTLLQYEQQVATSTDILDARAFLTQADTNYYQSLYGYLIALGDLERAIGEKRLNEAYIKGVQ